MFCSTGHVWELIADNIRKARYFLRLEIKCSVRYSGKRGGHKGSSLRYDQSRQVHLVCVCLVWCFVYTLLFIKSAAAAIIIWDYFFQITLRFKRKEARNLMFFCLLSPKCHLKEINSPRWVCCFDSTHQDSKIRFYYRYSTQKKTTFVHGKGILSRLREYFSLIHDVI